MSSFGDWWSKESLTRKFNYMALKHLKCNFNNQEFYILFCCNSVLELSPPPLPSSFCSLFLSVFGTGDQTLGREHAR